MEVNLVWCFAPPDAPFPSPLPAKIVDNGVRFLLKHALGWSRTSLPRWGGVRYKSTEYLRIRVRASEC